VKDTPPFDADAHTAQSREAWTAAAPRYEELSFALFGATAKEFAAFAGLRKGWRVLDLACGPGIASRAAARAVGEKGSVLAGDLSPGMLARAAAREPERRAAPVEWREMNAESLDLPDASFDATVCQLGLMLFARPDAALAEMTRVTVPGGVVACMVQGRRSAMLFTALVFDALIARARHLKAPPGAPTLYAFGHAGVLEESFTRAGLTEISSRRLTGVFRFRSGREYWDTMTSGAGRTAAMLATLDETTQAKIRGDVIRRAERLRVRDFVEIPYEFAMARGLVPSLR
jgi:ubiquinone/menaquinone biosynthesis C-methylase UbiE